MAKTITGFFRTQNEGHNAQTALKTPDSPASKSALWQATRAGTNPEVGPSLEDAGSESEAASDAWIGGVVDWPPA